MGIACQCGTRSAPAAGLIVVRRGAGTRVPGVPGAPASLSIPRRPPATPGTAWYGLPQPIALQADRAAPARPLQTTQWFQRFGCSVMAQDDERFLLNGLELLPVAGVCS